MSSKMTLDDHLNEKCIEYNDRLQGIHLELELFKRTNLTNKPVIILEDNQTICLQLSAILKKTGFTKIKFCEDMEQGLHVFNQVHDNYEEAIIFLSFFSNDAAIMKFIWNVFNTNPFTKIILLTSPEQNSLTNRAIIRGAFDLLEIPLSIPKVSAIIDKIKQEYSDEQEFTTQSLIQTLLSRRKTTTVTELSELSGASPDKISEFFKFLKSISKTKSLGNVKLISCNSCNSTLVEQLFLCHNCSSKNYVQEDLIEHYPCGNISRSKEYHDETCPKCKKKITVVGADYRKLSEYFICDDCNDKFSEPQVKYSCKKCNNEFSFNSAQWTDSEKFLLLDE